MNTLLIVEDNEFERNALKHYIDWDIMGIKVIETAYNGKDGLEKAKLYQPDIIISDVMMPVMNGIEMARAIVFFNPGIKFVFSSGHDDIALLRDAMEIRAYSYLLKPLKPNEFIAVIKKLVSVSMDEKLSQSDNRKMTEQFQHHLPYLQTQFLKEIMTCNDWQVEQNMIYSKVEDLKLQLTGLYRVALIEMDFGLNPDIVEISIHLSGIMGELQHRFEREDVVSIKDGDNRIIVLLYSLRTGSGKEEQLLWAIKSKVAELMEHHLFQYVIGASKDASDLTGLSNLYQQCCAIIQRKASFGFGRMIHYEDHRDHCIASSDMDENRIQQLTDEIIARTCEGHDCKDCVRELADVITAYQDLKLDRIQSVFIGMFSRLFKSIESTGEQLGRIAVDEIQLYHCIITIKSIPNLCGYIYEILSRISTYTGRKKLGKEDYIVQEILGILDKEYGKPITLSYLSERVFLSPNYLRILFKRKMNVSIQDYLTKLRIDKAKDLLKQNHHKVYEVGELVGYEHSTYFNMVFKNYVQLTPGEYRSKHMMFKSDS